MKKFTRGTYDYYGSAVWSATNPDREEFNVDVNGKDIAEGIDNEDDALMICLAGGAATELSEAGFDPESFFTNALTIIQMLNREDIKALGL